MKVILSYGALSLGLVKPYILTLRTLSPEPGTLKVVFKVIYSWEGQLSTALHIPWLVYTAL